MNAATAETVEPETNGDIPVAATEADPNLDASRLPTAHLAESTTTYPDTQAAGVVANGPLVVEEAIGEDAPLLEGNSRRSAQLSSGDATSTDYTGSIVGRVIFDGSPYSGTKWPLAISAFDEDQALVATVNVDSNGYYAVDQLPVGNYTLQIVPDRNSDYAEAFYPSAVWREDATPISVIAGQVTSDINFDLDRGVNLSGNVVGASDTIVLVTAYRLDQGAWRAYRTTAARTAGNYDFRGGSSPLYTALPPGEYRVGFRAVGYCEQFWRGVTAVVEAETISPTPGSTYRGIDAVMTKSCLPQGIVAGEPSVSGTAKVGRTLTADPGTWLPEPVTLSYQWLADGTRIVGAQSQTFTPTAAEVGKAISVLVWGYKSGFTSVAATSGATSAILRGDLTTDIPSVNGEVKVGNKLTVDPGKWGPGPVSFDYRWFAGSESLWFESGPTLGITPELAGKQISVQVTGYASGFMHSVTKSLPTVPVAPGDIITGDPTISGAPRVGSTLTVDAGSWGPDPVTVAYQWRADDTEIIGETGNVFTLTAAQVGKKITVRVTGTKTGYTTASATSTATVAVAKGDLTAKPTPTIAGTAKVGETLTVGPGTWAPSPVTLAYQWFADGAAISGATSTTLKLAAAQQGKKITVRVTGSKAGYAAASATSAPTVAVAAATPVQPFVDVSGVAGSPSYSQFNTEITWMFTTGISTGYEIGAGKREYRPFNAVARDAMAAFLYRAAGKPAFTAPKVSPFVDVPTTHLFYKEIAWMSSKGIFTGWDVGGGRKEFRPSASITRDAMAAFLYRFAGQPKFTAPATSPFTDVVKTQSFYKEITWLASTGVSTGWAVNGKKEFRPFNAITRDAMAAFLYRFKNLK